MTENKQYSFNVNKNTIEFDGKFKAYVNIVDGQRIVDLLNEQHEVICICENRIAELRNENKQLKARIEHLERKIQRERNSHIKQHEKWEEEIQKENEKLKHCIKKLQNELNIYSELFNELNALVDDNEQLKQQVEDLEFKLRTIKAYDRTVKEEHSDTVYDFQKKLEKW